MNAKQKRQAKWYVEDGFIYNGLSAEVIAQDIVRQIDTDYDDTLVYVQGVIETFKRNGWDAAF